MHIQNQFIKITRSSSENARLDLHYHNEYEIIYIESGKIKLNITGNEYIAGKNSIIFLNNLELHSIRVLEQPYTRYIMTLTPNVTDSLIHNTNLLSIIKNHPEHFVHCIDVTAFAPAVKHIFEKLMTISDYGSYSTDLAVCYITELLIEINKHYPEGFEVPDSSFKKRLLEIQKYIDLHYSENLRIDDLCKKFYISHSFLSHKFKECTGFSPKQYLIRIRLNYAAVMLRDTSVPISDIIFRTGFNDINNFTRYFKKEYGVPPSKYRSEYQKNSVSI